jgi:hypothetical protein
MRSTRLSGQRLPGHGTCGSWMMIFDIRMGAIAVSTHPDTGANEDMRSGTWPGSQMVAACLVQSPPYVVPGDDHHAENAQLIAAMRTALPHLLRLARLGLRQEG